VAQDAAALITDTVTEAARHILPRSMTGADDSGGKDRAKDRGYAHLAEDSRKSKKDKARSKASKH
jgi:hypothetical protein